MVSNENQNMINLDEIITAQVDEPDQKSCIYKVTRTAV